MSKQAQAQIATDGSVGQALKLKGPSYQIPSTLGQIRGRNLFHSFKEFNLEKGQSATFAGPGSIRNILSRVTNGQPSHINGSINSGIAGANFFFLNPNGLLFGPEANINVSGSFTTSTADYLRLQDGTKFNANLSGVQTPIFSSASPAAFGFLQSNRGRIRVDGSNLKVNPGQVLSFVGRDLGMSNAQVFAPQGQLNLVAVGSAGEVVFDATRLGAKINTSTFDRLGNITFDKTSMTSFNTSDKPGLIVNGGIVLRGNNILINRSDISVDNFGQTSGGLVQIHADNSLVIHISRVASTTQDGAGAPIEISAGRVTLDALKDQSAPGITITSTTQGSGRGGDISVHTGDLQILDGGGIASQVKEAGRGGDVTIVADRVRMASPGNGSFTGLGSLVEGSGRGGDISLRTGTLDTSNDALIYARSSGIGDGGTIDIRAGAVQIANSLLISESESGGHGGDIVITTDTLRILNGGVVNSSAGGHAKGGDIHIGAAELLLDGKSTTTAPGELTLTGVFAESKEYSSAAGGSIELNSKNVEIRNGAVVVARTYSSHDGGDLIVNAPSLTIDGRESPLTSDGAPLVTGIGTESQATLVKDGQFIVPSGYGNGGMVQIQSKQVNILDGGSISSTTFSDGMGGQLRIKADQILLSGRNVSAVPRFTGLAAQTASPVNGGNGGQIILRAKSLQILDNSALSTLTQGDGNSGRIDVQADSVVLDSTNGPFGAAIAGVTMSQYGDVGFPGGSGGDISVRAKNVRLSNGATISSRTLGDGRGGNIEVKANNIVLDSRTSELGATIDVDNGDKNAKGDAGNITLAGKRIDVFNGGVITAATIGSGKGGSINISGESLTIDGAGPLAPYTVAGRLTGIDAHTESNNELGNAGNVNLNIAHILVTSGGQISASTTGAGQGGNIDIKAKDVKVNGMGVPYLTDIRASTSGEGNGGDIVINTDSFDLEQGAGLRVNSTSAGKGGDVTVNARNIQLSRNSTIRANSSGAGDAGQVTLQVGEKVAVQGNSDISTSADQASGSNISINVGDSIYLRDGNISSFAAKNGGNLELRAGRVIGLTDSDLNARAGDNGGNIRLGQKFVYLNGSHLRADAVQYKGGDITIQGSAYVPSWESSVTASSTFGVAGTILVEAPDPNLGASLRRLPDNPLNAEDFLRERCILRSGRNSSFQVHRQYSPLPEPSAPLSVSASR